MMNIVNEIIFTIIIAITIRMTNQFHTKHVLALNVIQFRDGIKIRSREG